MTHLVKAVILLAISLTFAGCSSTGNHEPFTYSNTKTAVFDDVEYVCKTERITGSHLTRQVCWTSKEYAELEEDTEKANQRMRTKALQSSKDNYNALVMEPVPTSK